MITLLTPHNILLDIIASGFYFSFSGFFFSNNDNGIVPLFAVYINCVMLLRSLHINSYKHSPKFEPTISSSTMLSYNLRQGVPDNHFIQLGFKNKFSYVRLKEMQGVHSFADIGRIFGLVAKKEKKSQHGLDHFHIMHLFSIKRFMRNQ